VVSGVFVFTVIARRPYGADAFELAGRHYKKIKRF
jgi:hypothetical protein